MSSIFPTFTPCFLSRLGLCVVVLYCVLSLRLLRLLPLSICSFSALCTCTCTCTFCTVVYGAYTIHVQYNVHVDTRGFCLPISSFVLHGQLLGIRTLRQLSTAIYTCMEEITVCKPVHVHKVSN